MNADVYQWIKELNMAAFAQHLRLLRQARNITQARLAELIGVSPRVYNRWEKGGNVPHFDTVVKIADILQVSLDELAGRIEPSLELKLKNHELLQLCQQCDGLPDQDQQALIVMMDSLVKKANMAKVIGQASNS